VFTKLESAWTKLEPKVMVLVDAMGMQLLVALDMVLTSAVFAADGLDRMVTFLDKTGQAIQKLMGISTAPKTGTPTAAHASSTLASKIAEPRKALAKPTAGAGGGGGGVNVHKVEIVVTSNQDPNRIARVVESHLAALSRFRKSSPYSPNFSATR
jgi:hypothetical protein